MGHENSKFRFLRIEGAKTIAIACTRCRKAYYVKIYNKSWLWKIFIFDGLLFRDCFRVGLGHGNSKFRFLWIEGVKTIAIAYTRCRKAYYVKIYNKSRLWKIFIFDGLLIRDCFRVGLGHGNSKFRFLRIEGVKTIAIAYTRCRKAYYVKIYNKS